MLKTLSRLFSFSPAKRSLEAASTSRRWPDAPRGRDSLLQSAAVLSQRAEYFSLNNAYGSRIVQVATQNLVGAGIVARSQHANETLRQKLRVEWQAFCEGVDREGLGDFYACQAASVRDLVTYGEALFTWHQEPASNRPQLARLHPDQLDRSLTRQLPDGVIVQGVEFGKDGKRRAYWIRPLAPGALLAGNGMAPQRVPAGSILHMFRPLVPGQVRGLSWFAPILIPARELDQLLDALLVRAKVGAMYVGSITDTDGEGPRIDGEQKGSVLDTSIEPGTVRVEAPGKELRWNEPPSSGDAPTLATTTLQMMAAGAGVTYEALTGDYSKVNYSSARAAILEFRRLCEQIQHHVVIHQFCRPVWQQFIKWQILKGNISATAYKSDTASFDVAKWLPPAWQWVDPLKDTNAAILAMKNALRSRSDIVGELGYDIEDIDREIAADKVLQDLLNPKGGTTNGA